MFHDEQKDMFYRKSPLSDEQYEMFEPAEYQIPPEDGFGLYLISFGAAALISLGLIYFFA